MQHGPSLETIDESVLDSLQEVGGDSLLTEIVEMFLSDCPLRLEKIRTSIGEGDVTGTEDGAHSLKGAAGAVGAMGLHAICAELEMKAMSGSLDGAGEYLRRISDELDKVSSYLAGKLGSDRRMPVPAVEKAR